MHQEKKSATALVGFALVLAMSVDTADAQQLTPVESRLHDGAQLLCTTDRGISEGVDRDGSSYVLDVLRRHPDRAKFRVLYRPSDDGASAFVWLSGRAPALSRFDQERMPEPVEPASLTFVRSEPSAFSLIQFDPWDDDTTTFAWVERRQGHSSVAHGKCRPVE
jgi:hypothetical protein